MLKNYEKELPANYRKVYEIDAENKQTTILLTFWSVVIAFVFWLILTIVFEKDSLKLGK